MNFDYPEGATPLDADEAAGLLLTHITNRYWGLFSRNKYAGNTGRIIRITALIKRVCGGYLA